MRIGVKFYPEPSSFKEKLLSLRAGDRVVAAQLSGDFTLPKDTGRKLAFIAGGIGVTPFRSQVRYLIDHKEKRSITLLYANKTPDDLAYKALFDEAGREIGMRTSYVFTDSSPDRLSPGKLDGQTIAREIPDYRERLFYVSGPQGMVSGVQKTLRSMGVPGRNIKTDYFPGFA